ncbi:hypothetical protein P175DRAFT_0498825 [Aspergillus ochraceoroseus IBT 24754]|uniref:Uncharacterized protein n=1 Tax=Aspergillus ochraceoroseus IBT 24754 TaxID=1392256 RepID=A0A2T5M193_9EURO|nr:uncharacterized protein P175DRAFT_0498825 [Aspergillus ochraceoroseus IBT 24754]PTU22289.1 hypothetical protein P175DRAFT_0498825 [Aspergillus ochraceoroseus IBT 24754]
MKGSIFATACTTLLMALATATPTEKRVFDVSITFHGADNQSYTMLFPADINSVKIDNPMVVHSISSPGGGFCTLTGTEGETVVIYAEDEQTLKTPQPMAWGACDNN